MKQAGNSVTGSLQVQPPLPPAETSATPFIWESIFLSSNTGWSQRFLEPTRLEGGDVLGLLSLGLKLLVLLFLPRGEEVEARPAHMRGPGGGG